MQHTQPPRHAGATRFTFGVVPLLTLLSSEFPELRNAIFAWLQPLVNALVNSKRRELRWSGLD